MKVLIVDDYEAVRRFIDRVLRDAGYDTMTARDGVEAQRLVLRDGAPDVVLTDESMPRMSGHELAHWVQSNFPMVKVVFLDKPCTIRGLLGGMKKMAAASAPPCAQSAR